MDKINILKKISKDLQLQYEAQDWGIINASGDRVNEFICYFEKNNYPDYINYELYELVISSFNDLIVANRNEEIIVRQFKNFITTHINEPYAYVILDYWRGIYNTTEFPVAKYF